MPLRAHRPSLSIRSRRPTWRDAAAARGARGVGARGGPGAALLRSRRRDLARADRRRGGARPDPGRAPGPQAPRVPVDALGVRPGSRRRGTARSVGPRLGRSGGAAHDLPRAPARAAREQARAIAGGRVRPRLARARERRRRGHGAGARRAPCVCGSGSGAGARRPAASRRAAGRRPRRLRVTARSLPGRSLGADTDAGRRGRSAARRRRAAAGGTARELRAPVDPSQRRAPARLRAGGRSGGDDRARRAGVGRRAVAAGG